MKSLLPVYVVFIGWFLLIAIPIAEANQITSRDVSISFAKNTVILANPSDLYYELAEEISQEEGLKIVHCFDEVFAYKPVFLLWIVSPSRLSDPEKTTNLEELGFAEVRAFQVPQEWREEMDPCQGTCKGIAL